MTDSPAKSAQPRPTVLSAGGEVDAWCTKCKMDLGHRIVAMVGPTPKRVICQTCSSEHNYRAPKGAETPKPVRKKAATTKKATSANAARVEWETQIRSGKPLRPYAIDSRFKEGELISHKKFGDGYVVSAGPGKISVVFESGQRILVQAGS